MSGRGKAGASKAPVRGGVRRSAPLGDERDHCSFAPVLAGPPPDWPTPHTPSTATHAVVWVWYMGGGAGVTEKEPAARGWR